MMERLLDNALQRLVQRGQLKVTYPDGSVREYGPGPEHPPSPDDRRAVTPVAGAVSLRIHDRATVRRILLNPDLGVAEGYMDGRLTIEGDDLRGLLVIAMVNTADSGRWRLWRLVPLRQALRPLTEINRIARSVRNVHHHYDLSSDLYKLFLDGDRQYSCGYFRNSGLSLDEAQEAKKHHIIRKLRVQPGMRVLDIGCGWGGMAITLAQDYGARVTGITLSGAQLEYGRRKVAEAGLASQIDLQLVDYRAVKGQFDRIVSVGMFEHVGAPQYRTFYRVVRNRLTEDGIGLIHSIGSSAPPAPTSSFIRKYIFPGGALPSLSQIAATCEREGVIITDVEVLRRHYAETLKHWRERFEARADEAQAIYDARFVRMWRFYLLASEMSFRVQQLVVFQVQVTRRNDALPITRNYMFDPPHNPEKGGVKGGA